MKMKGTRIRITVKPREEYLELDYRGEWFYERVKGWKVGEAIIREGEILLTFSKEVEMGGRIKVGIDCNMRSLDVYHPEEGRIKVDISEVHRIAERYDEIIDKLKSMGGKKVRRAMRKYQRRKKARIEDYLNKLAVQLVREFHDAVFVFEDHEKGGMLRGKEFNRRLSRVAWKKIMRKVSYRARVEYVNAAGTSSRCRDVGGK